MNIVFFEVEPHEISAFKPLEDRNQITLVEHILDSDTVREYVHAEVVSTFIFSRLDHQVLERLPSLRLIATRSTGFDHIDLDYCASHGIAVANVPSYGENTVAEHVFALLLAISHRLPEAMDRAQKGVFSPRGLQGFDLAGRTLGIIGTGHIGQHVIRIARGFQMRVLAYDISPQSRLPAELGFHYADLATIYSEADIISLHVPSLSENRNMLSTQAFSKMKDGIVLINTARGDLIDTRAFIHALNSGKVAAAGLDVLPDEALIREEAELVCSIYCKQYDLRDLVASHVLLRMPNVVVTPHSAFNTREALQRIVETTVENMRAFARGRPQNLIAVPVAKNEKKRS